VAKHVFVQRGWARTMAAAATGRGPRGSAVAVTLLRTRGPSHRRSLVRSTAIRRSPADASPRDAEAGEHTFVSIKGSPYARFQRSSPRETSASSRLPPPNSNGSTSPTVSRSSPDDQAGDPRFERAAARWVGRLLTETPPMTLTEARWAVAMVEQLPALPRVAARACAPALRALLAQA